MTPTLKRGVTLLVALLGGIAAFAVSASAGAAPYVSSANCSVSRTAVPAGSTVSLSCTGFTAGGTADISLHSPAVSLGSATVGSDGSFSATLTIPSSTRPGVHHIVANESSGQPQHKRASVKITVTAAGAAGTGGAGGTGGLAFTGVAVLGIGTLGLILVIGGAVMLLIGRRRSPST